MKDKKKISVKIAFLQDSTSIVNFVLYQLQLNVVEICFSIVVELVYLTTKKSFE